MSNNPLYYLMTLLEFNTVILFAIGGYIYYRLVCTISEKPNQIIALIGVISCFVGGLPNAIDKLCWTFFNYDTIFNSTWMFFFVGIGYVCLFISSINMKSNKNILAIVPAFHKPMKYVSMLAASIGMFGFYIVMFNKSKKVIGGKSYYYLITLIMTVFLIVFSAVGKFTTPLPNIIAQTANGLGYIAFIFANNCYRKKLIK